MTHPRNVGWGEIGLDYHYDNSPRDVQREVFSRQLRHAVRLRKPITVHAREAEEDAERILKAEVPKDHKVRFTVYIGHASAYAIIFSLSDVGEPPDTHTLLHRLARFRAAFVGPLSEPLHRHHRYVSFSSTRRGVVHD
jgi:Tat protein secretion system quality control protein TatD with DNase activity